MNGEIKNGNRRRARDTRAHQESTGRVAKLSRSLLAPVQIHEDEARAPGGESADSCSSLRGVTQEQRPAVKDITTNKSVSKFPCPICRNIIFVIGTNNKGKKIGSCGCTWKFKQTKSAKEMDRKYIKTADGGLELRK